MINYVELTKRLKEKDEYIISKLSIYHELASLTNVEELAAEDVDEIAVYKEIKEKLSIQPVRIFYKPDDMELVDYDIFEEILTAQLLYKYQDEIIRYLLYINDVDSSWGQKEEDNKINTYTVTVNGIEIEAEEFQVKNSSENRQMATFEYKGAHYQIIGVMEKNEFEKILKNLYFY